MIPIRDENPALTTPYVLYLLVAVNVLVFFAEVVSGLGQPPGVLAGLMLVPREVTTGTEILRTNGPTIQPFWLTIFTSMFMHASWLHIGGNMLYLWIFGNNIEDALGHAKFLFFYLACGAIAAFVHIASAPDSIIPTLGASGAIAGVLGAYIVLYPTAKITSLVFFLFIMVMDIPAVILLGIWFAIQFLGLGGAGMQQGGGVAYYAHVGGFIAGIVLIMLFGGPRLAHPLPRRRRRTYYSDGWYER